MSSNDFIIKIILDAQSKIAPVMAAASAEAKKLEDRFGATGNAASKLDGHVKQLDTHVAKLRDTVRSTNPTMSTMKDRAVALSSAFGGLNREAGKTPEVLAKFNVALESSVKMAERLDKRLSELDRKMATMGSRKFEPKIDVKTGESEAKVNALIGRLASATRGVYTAKTDVEIGAAMAKAQALRSELDRLGAGGRAERLIIEIDQAEYAKTMAQLEAVERKRKAAMDTGKMHGPNLPDQAEIDTLLLKLRTLTDQRYKIKTDVEDEISKRKIAGLRNELRKLGAGSDAKELEIQIRAKLLQAELDADLKSLARRARESTTPVTLRAILDGNANKELDDLRRKMLAISGIHVDPSVGLDDARAQVGLKRLEAELTRLGLRREHIEVVVDIDRRGTASQLADYFDQQAQAMSDRASGHFSGLSTRLRDMAIGLAFIFAEPLLSALTGVVGGLIAVGSSAGVAVAGLMGLASAAVAQAIPALSVLIFSFARFASVIKASSLAQQERDKGAQQSIGIDNQKKAALDSLAQAHRGVEDAQQRLLDAQKKLNEERKNGVRTLQDMRLAEQRASLSAQQAQMALATAIATGSGGQLIGSLQLDARAAELAAQRQREDSASAQRGGIDGLPAVTAAKKGVEAATRALSDAQRQVKQAEAGIAQAATKMGAAASAYEIALAKLSAGERVLLRSLEAFKKLFSDTDGAIRKSSDRISLAFAYTLNNMVSVLKDPAILNALDGLAAALAGSIRGLSDFMASSEMRGAFAFFSDQAANNLPVFTNALQSLVEIFVNLATAASGPLAQALGEVDIWLAGIAEKTATLSGQQSLASFFGDSLRAMGAFLNLGGSVVNLFAALVGSGGAADEGNRGINELADSINRVAGDVRKNGSEVQRFFRDAIDVTLEFLHVVYEIGAALVETFDPASVEKFGEFIVVVVLPIFTSFVKVIGAVTRALLEIANHPVGRFMINFAAATAGVALAVGRLHAAASLLLSSLGRLIGVFGYVQTGLARIAQISTPVKVAFVAVAVALDLITGKVDNFSDAVERLLPLAAGLATAFAASKFLPAVGGAASAATAAVNGAAAGGILSRLGGGAAAGEALTGSAAAAGLSRFSGLLRASVVSSLGLSVAMGLASGFKHDSVKAGIQDFGSTLSLGIVKSYSESIAKINAEAGVSFKSGVDKRIDPNQLLASRPQADNSFSGIVKTLSVRGAAGGVGNYVETVESNKILRSLQEMGAQGKLLQSDLKTILVIYNKLTSIGQNESGAKFLDSYIKSVREFAKRAPKEFQPGLDAIVAAAKKARDKMVDDLNKPLAVDAKRLEAIVQFGSKLQAPKVDTKSLLDSFFRDMDQLPPYARKKMKESGLAMVEKLEEAGKITKPVAEEMRDGIADRWTELQQKSSRAFKKMQQDAERKMVALNIAISTGVGNAVTATNAFLDALGVQKVKLPDGSQMKSLLGVQIASTPGDTLDNGRAVGGWIGQPGERGSDQVRTVLGRGEAVLNSTHQKVVEPALHAMYGFGLNGLFKSTRGAHAGDPSGGYASGGFVNNVGARIDTDAQRAIAAALAKLGRSLGITFSPVGPRSGRRTPEENAAVGGSKTSNHLRGRAMDVAPDAIKTISNSILNKFGLNRPIPGNWVGTDGRVHDERNHIELLPGVVSQIGEAIIGAIGSVQRTFKKLTVPDFGTGPLAGLGEALLKKVADAANQKMEESSGGSSSGGSIPSFSGPWVAVMEKIAKSRQWNLGDWKALVQGESGGNPAAVNPSSGAYGLGQFLGSTKTAYAKYGATSPDGAKQIRAMAQYILDRYGNPSNAYRTWLGRNPHWYALGGAVPGSGSGDTVPAMLTPGEHVWTKREVQAAGGHQAMFAMRRMLGGGGQGGQTENAYANGGQVLKGSELVFSTKSLIKIITEGFSRIVGVADFDAVEQVISKAIGAIKLVGTKTSKAIGRVANALDFMVSDSGPLAVLEQKIQARASQAARALSDRINRVGPGGSNPTRGLDDQEVIAQSEIAALGEQRSGYDTELANIDSLIATNKKALGQAKTASQRKRLRGTLSTLNSKRSDVLQQISDTNAQIVQRNEQRMSDNLATANSGFDRERGAAERVSRLTGAGYGSEAYSRFNVQIAISTRQITDLTARLQEAKAAGNNSLAQQIQEQIDELNVSVTELAASKIRAAIDTINNGSSRATGLIGRAGQIMTSIASAAGLSTVDAQRSQLTATRDVLASSGAALMEQFSNAIGSGSFGGQGSAILQQLATGAASGPEQFARTLQALAPQLTQFESTLGPESLAAFQALVNGLTENELAVVENTGALRALDESVTQTFTSTAWTTFRQAIFNGNGGLMPQYDIPQMHTGGYVTRSGLFELQAGERVLTTQQQNNGGDVNVNAYVTSPTEVADANHLAQRIAWEIKTSGKN